MRYADPSGGEPAAIRWEAWSHPRIYDTTHTSGTGPANSLAATVPLWREIVADLGEVRTRYDAAVDRLNEASAGANADAADAKSLLVTRCLTEAQELASVAGAKRARLNELNQRLLRQLPEPGVPAEDRTAFLDGGLGWLTVPEFHNADRGRLNAEEIARDLMRDYEKGISPDALAADAHNSAVDSAAGYSGQTGDEPTIPLSGTAAAGGSQADRAQTAVQPVGGGVEPSVDGDGPLSGRLGLITRGPGPSGYFWNYADFGPEGHSDHDGGTDTSSGHSGGAAAGPVPALRDYTEELGGRSLVSDNLFEPDIRVSRQIIGE